MFTSSQEDVNNANKNHTLHQLSLSVLLPANNHRRQWKRAQEIPLQGQAEKMSDNDDALVLNTARKKLFKDISALIRKQA
ncbi:hypothetical protein [Nitrosomonas sp.]|uniref:hypothetical protein n=1 Tax=Nitrosomonas sp. TaxID=42353 RepID=UPI0025FF1147|nr:hypothetical protein [Nitrosomonas sp.]MBY0483727.1 hypothetical protein [Nitrosomonas sp.]